MKNQVSFMSELFETSAPIPTQSTAEYFGKDVAVWLAKKSIGSEFEFTEPVKSKGGWSHVASANGEAFTLDFGIVPESIGAEYAEWLITIDTPKKWQTLKENGSPSRSRLCDHIRNVLRDEGRIREVHWC
jgi:hypothetical protein